MLKHWIERLPTPVPAIVPELIGVVILFFVLGSEFTMKGIQFVCSWIEGL